jgi:uncharacterized paraquat-inducible protein A
MNLVISSGKSKSTSRPTATTGRGPGSRSCGCGQQLDVCARAHCPRCGRTVRRG